MYTINTAQDLADRFHNNNLYHIGHFIVMMAVPLVIMGMIRIMNRLQEENTAFGVE